MEQIWDYKPTSSSVRAKRNLAAIAAVLAIAAQTAVASASEYGISTYRPGLVDLFAGYLGPPGTTLVKGYLLFQDANEKAITQNGRIEADAHTTTYTSAVFAAYITSLRLLGSYWGAGAITQFRIAAQSLRVAPVSIPVGTQNSTVAGLGDEILLPLMFSWNFGQFHLASALAFYAPTGSYDRQRIINIGCNRWAVEPDAGLPWMDEEHGREASLFVGYTINTQNTATDYLSGDEFHADFALAQHLPQLRSRNGRLCIPADHAGLRRRRGLRILPRPRARPGSAGGQDRRALETPHQRYRQVRLRVCGAKSIDRQRIVAYRRSAVLMSIEQAEKSLAPSHGQALSAGMQEFRLNLELLPEAAMIYAIDGTILSVNSITARIFEADASEIIGKNLFSMGALKAEEARAALARLMRGEAIRFQVDFTSLKGHQHRLEVLHVPMFTATGEVERVLGFARDITQAKRTEGERALLAAIVESSEDAIVSLSTDLTILSWNRGAEKLLGFSADEAIGQPVTLYIPPDLRAYGMNLLREMMQHLDRVQSLEVPCLRKDGTSVDVWTVCFGIRDSSGRLLGMSAIHRDLTARKQAEREQALLAALVKSSDDAIISLSTDFRITSWNQGAQRLLGYKEQEVLGRSPLDVYVPPQDRAQAQAMMAEDLATIKPDSDAMRALEVVVRKKDGTPIEVSLVACAIRDAGGKVIGMSTILRDVTERRRAEREMAALATVVNSSHDAIIGFSREIKITSWNPAAENIYGYPAREAIGRGFNLSFHHRSCRARSRPTGACWKPGSPYPSSSARSARTGPGSPP